MTRSLRLVVAVVALLCALGRSEARQGPSLNQIDDFLQQWLVRQDVEAAARRFSIPHVSRQLGGMSDDAVSGWVARVLTMWLVEDHGTVAAQGHGDPSSAAWQALPATPVAISGRRRQFQSLDAALVHPGPEGGKLYQRDSIKVPNPQELELRSPMVELVHFQLRGLPTDVISLAFGEVAAAGEKPSLRVISFSWTVK